jgi:GTPase SAR1 family protein
VRPVMFVSNLFRRQHLLFLFFSIQDEYSLFQKHYAIGIHGYILVYSVTSKKSFEMVKIINDKLLNSLGTEKVPRVLVGNKTDLRHER